ncbi:hypothetical protein Anapl_15998 [Anas platyrhynchos]|uniref:Uncharacterized protein n=1 Tax=Anas platyrhynchos TaxID=8839 RepID=R0KYM7_ANAPL|nr:hypothetical protein Anapl_15998 [Anas platyrhynchos]
MPWITGLIGAERETAQVCEGCGCEAGSEELNLSQFYLNQQPTHLVRCMDEKSQAHLFPSHIFHSLRQSSAAASTVSEACRAAGACSINLAQLGKSPIHCAATLCSVGLAQLAVWYLLGPPNQWGKQRELQDSGTVAVELSGFNGICILTCVEGKAAGRSDIRHYSLINQQFLLRTATNKATLLQKIYKSFVTCESCTDQLCVWLCPAANKWWSTIWVGVDAQHGTKPALLQQKQSRYVLTFTGGQLKVHTKQNEVLCSKWLLMPIFTDIYLKNSSLSANCLEHYNFWCLLAAFEELELQHTIKTTTNLLRAKGQLAPKAPFNT